MKPRARIDWNEWNGTLAGYWWLIEDAELRAEQEGLVHGQQCFCTGCAKAKAEGQHE